MKRPRVVIALLLLVFVAVVVLQNTETVETRLLFATVSMPRAMLLGGTLAIGVLSGFLLGARFERRRTR